MRHHSVRHRPSSCPSDLRSGGSRKSGNASLSLFKSSGTNPEGIGVGICGEEGLEGHFEMSRT
eukprot:950498-Prorocentrum_minimum.AAC.2